MSTPRIVLRITDVTKRFPGVTALRNVSLEVFEGEIHALVGENGAGKSTLMSVAAGSTIPDHGSVEIGGALMSPPSPGLAQNLGLAIAHQHPALLRDLTVVENLFLGMPRSRRPSARTAHSWALERLAVAGAEIDPAARVSELTVAQRQLLEIAKALSLEPKVLILDEPTEPLNQEEIERLFTQVRDLAAAGTAIVYISHRIPDVLRISERVTVLRDGEGRGTFTTAGTSEHDIVNLIVGREVDTVFPPKLVAGTDEPRAVLELNDFSGDGFQDVSLTVRPGEIVGLAGIEGNGQREFMRALAGLGSASQPIQVDGARVKVSTAISATRAGIAYMPQDRHNEALMMTLTVRENAALMSLGDHSVAGVVNGSSENRAVRGQIESLNIRTPSPETIVSSLSGGNQQKVVLARALLAGPKVLLADEPTQGVDAGARVEIYRILREAADSGVAVIVLSSDGIELAGLSDRVLIFSRGHVVQELEGDEVTEEHITHAALTATSLRRRSDIARRAVRIRRFAGGDYAPPFVLMIAMLGLGAYAAGTSGRYLTELNFNGVLTLLAALAFIAMGQLVVLMTGGIDLSVGPLTGLVVVAASFFVLDGKGVGMHILGFVVMFAVAAAVGTTNGVLVRKVKLNPVAATLAMYIVIQGISLLLRPKPDGSISYGVTDAITRSVGFVPIAFIVVVVVAVGLEVALRFTYWGMKVRAVGSNPQASHRLGVPVERTYIGAYILCALLTTLGGVMLMAQIGIGDATSGIIYTLWSITAVVLGGASIFGGRGSFVAAVFGAALLQQIVNSTSFLNLTQSWQFWLLGILTIVAAGSYSKARQVAAA